MGNYKISKVLNNNVVIVCDEKDRELIALGGGVGFGKKRGEYTQMRIWKRNSLPQTVKIYIKNF